MALRLLCESDLSLILGWRNTPAVRMSMFSTHEISETEHRAWFSRTQENPTVRWYIYENEQGTADGVISLTEINEKNRSAFWGFYTNPSAPLGTGTKLGLQAMNQAFEVDKFRKLSTEVLANNEKSLKLHRRLGFREEGIFKEHHLTEAGYTDVVRFGMLSSEWRIHQPDVLAYISQFNMPGEVSTPE